MTRSPGLSSTEQKRRQRLALSGCQNHRCCYCGQEMTQESDFNNTATIEHVVPRGRGGKNEMANKVAACYRCNNARGCLPAYIFFESVQRNPELWPVDTSTMFEKIITDPITDEERDEIKRLIDEMIDPEIPSATSALADMLDEETKVKLLGIRR